MKFSDKIKKYQEGGSIKGFTQFDPDFKPTSESIVKFIKDIKDRSVIKERKQLIKKSDDSRKKSGEFSKEAFANSAAGEKLRLFPNDPNSIIDNYLNPLKMVGDMADGLGKAWFDKKSTKLNKVVSIANPLITGALAGVGAKSTGQFINNLVNPIGVNIKSILKKTPTDLPDPKQWLSDWNNHPINIEKRKTYEVLDPVYQNRNMTNVFKSETKQSTSRERYPFRDIKEIEVKNYKNLLKEHGFKNWITKYPTSDGLSHHTMGIYVKKAGSPRNDVKSATVHELTHNFENNGGTLNQVENEDLLRPFDLDYETFSRNVAKNPSSKKNYYTDPSEIHARMNEARYQLGLKPGSEFTDKHFDKVMQAKFFGMGKYIKDKHEMIKLMNKFYTPSTVTGAALLTAKSKEK